MSRLRFAALGLFIGLISLSLSAQAPSSGAEWARFRGPNGSGVSAAKNLPTEFGKTKNMLWRLELPQGHSSPILFGNRIYLTAFRGDELVTMAIDRAAGKILWERSAPKVATKVVDKRNNPASPSPAVEANSVYVFFPDYGLIAYDAAGAERWKLPLGPFNNIYGMGASPVIVGDQLILACDQSVGSFVMSLDKRTGKEKWRTARPEAKSGHSTPIVWRAPDGKDEILIPGSFLMTSYDAATGAKKWWVRGLSWEMKSVPVIDKGVLYINGYGSPEGEVGRQVILAPADEIWKLNDKDGNGQLSAAESPDKRLAAGYFSSFDLDASGLLSKDEWEYYRASMSAENALLAIKLGGKGDMTDSAIKWKFRRSVPQLPSPVFYQGVLYMVNDGGIVTSINPETGEMIEQGRVTGAGAHYSSPVAGDGHVYFTSERGKIAVLPPGGTLVPLVVNDLVEDCYATPALADGRIYVRTVQALYAFGSGS